MTNHPGPSPSRPAAGLGLEQLVFINDFTALALACRRAAPTSSRSAAARPSRMRPWRCWRRHRPRRVGLIPCGAGWQPLAGEGGHVSLAAGNAREAAIIAVLAARFGHVSAERALSGPGIAALHDAIRQLDGAPPCPPARQPRDQRPGAGRQLPLLQRGAGGVLRPARQRRRRPGPHARRPRRRYGRRHRAGPGAFSSARVPGAFRGQGAFSAYLAAFPRMSSGPLCCLSGAGEALDRATPAPPMPPEAQPVTHAKKRRRPPAPHPPASRDRHWPHLARRARALMHATHGNPSRCSAPTRPASARCCGRCCPARWR